MTIREAQDTVDKWIKEYGVRYFSELTNMACLTEEVGELARVMASLFGTKLQLKREIYCEKGSDVIRFTDTVTNLHAGIRCVP